MDQVIEILPVGGMPLEKYVDRWCNLSNVDTALILARQKYDTSRPNRIFAIGTSDGNNALKRAEGG